MANGDAVVGKQHVVVGMGVEVGLGHGVQSLDVIGILVEGLDAGDFGFRRVHGGVGVDLDHHSFPRGHRVVGILRD